jgi:hypothetical protein
MTKIIAEYLTNHSVKKDSGVSITNTRIGDKKESIYGGSYHIPESEYDSFMRLYFNEVIKKENNEYLTEKQLENGGPIFVDIDLRYDYSVENRIHLKEHVLSMVCLYLEELKEMFQFDRETHIPVFICEKSDVNRVE